MALGCYFTPSGFTQDKYDEAIAKLEAAGAGAPEGRSYHVALETNGEIQVFDIWESQGAFEAFGATLVPIMTELGADPGAPAAGPGAQRDQGLRWPRARPGREVNFSAGVCRGPVAMDGRSAGVVTGFGSGGGDRGRAADTL